MIGHRVMVVRVGNFIGTEEIQSVRWGNYRQSIYQLFLTYGVFRSPRPELVTER